MIGLGFLRCFFFGGIMIWYSASVWQTVDKYFRDQFRVYLENEYENNAEIKKDVMMEAQRMAAKKALIEKIAKMQFTQVLDKHVKEDESTGSERGGEIADEVEESLAEFIESGYANEILNAQEDGGGTEGTAGEVGPRGTVGTDGTEITDGTEQKEGKVDETVEEETEANELFREKYEMSVEEECESDVYEEAVEPEEGFGKWKGVFDEEGEVCRFEDLGKKDSCADP